MARQTGTAFECKDCGQRVVWAKTDSGSSFLANAKDKTTGKTWLDPHTPQQCAVQSKQLNEVIGQNRKRHLDEQVSQHPDVLAAHAQMREKFSSGDHEGAMAALEQINAVSDRVRGELAAAQQTPAAPQEKPKGFANKYAGTCVGCGTRVGANEGLTTRGGSGWEVRCVGCHHG